MVTLDFDGVLGDTEEAARRCAENLMTQAGLVVEPFPDRAALRAVFTTSALAGRIGKRGAETLIACHPIAMRTWGRGCHLHDGVAEFLAALPTRPSVITAGFASTAEIILAEHRDLVGSVLGHEHGSKSELLAAAVATAGSNSDIVVYATDTVRDIQRCRRVGARVVAVTWGYDSSHDLAVAQPDALVSTPSQLLDVVFGLDNGVPS